MRTVSNLKNNKNFYGPRLPVLKKLVDKITISNNLVSFNNIIIVCGQHLLNTTVSLIECLIELNVDPNNIFIVGKSYSNNVSVIEQLKKLGVYYQPTSSQLTLGGFVAAYNSDIIEMWKECYKFLQERTIKQEAIEGIIVLDDGGHVLYHLPANINSFKDFRGKKINIVGIEQTISGMFSTELVPCPTIAVATSAVKQAVEPYFIASKISEKVKNYFDIILPNKSDCCGIIGFGHVGKAIFKRLKELGHNNILVFDQNEKTRSEAGSNSVDFLSILISEAKLIFGCSGSDITSKCLDQLNKIQHDRFLVSCSSKDTEFLSLLVHVQRTLREKNISPLKDIYYKNQVGSTITIVRGGFPINFDNSEESVPASDIQLIRGLLATAVLQAYNLLKLRDMPLLSYKLNPKLQLFIISEWLKTQSTDRFSKEEKKQFTDINYIIKNSGGINGSLSEKLGQKALYEKQLVNDGDINLNSDIQGKLFEKQVCTLTNYLENIAETIPGSAYWKDINGVYLWCNNVMVQTAGFKYKSDIIGKTDYDLWPEQAENLKKNDLEVIKLGGTIRVEETVAVSSNEKMYFTGVKTPLKNEYGQIVGVLGNSLDITDRRLMEEKLKVVNEEMEKANQLKSEFISNMEHDVRTPCAGIAQMVKILEEQETDNEKRNKLNYVSKASEQLLNLLNSIIDFGHIENRNVSILAKKFNAKKVIKNVIDLEIPIIKSKKLELIVSLSDDIPEILIGDDYRFERIFINLLSNAVKFTEKGYIKIYTEVIGKKDERTIIFKIVVEDTGIGIPKDKQDIIYEKFSRVIPANKGTYDGVGLGLKIVRQFVEEMEGEIEVESDIGKGAIFTVILPFKLPLVSSELIKIEKGVDEKNEKDSFGKSEPKFIKTLLVEDDELAQMIAKDMIEIECGYNVDVAKTGKEALKLVKEELYDVIFMDIGLPDIDGNEVTKRIRKGKNYKSKDVTIIALTAHGTEDIKDNAYKSGMNDFILKPLNAEKIQNILNKWIYHKESEDNEKLEEISSDQEVRTEDKIIDIELTTKILGGKLKTAKEMIKALVDMLPEHKYNLGKAFCTNDFNELSKEAHKLYGATCYCGVPRLKKSLKELEIIALEKNDERKIQMYLNKACNEIDDVIREYEEDEELKN